MFLIRQNRSLSPFRELEAVEREFARTFDLGALPAWSPALDVHETDDAWLVTADLPGMRKEDIKISVENGLLTVQGEKKEVHEHKNARSVRSERLHGSFIRAVSLPEGVDTSAIQAEYKDGVLHLQLPKKEEAKPKSISVHVK
jgi:HSP20 family protein